MSAPRIGVIFDNDGVLVDSEHHSIAAYRRAIEEQGVSLQESDNEVYCGLTDADIIADMRRVYGTDLDLELFSARKNELYYTMAREGGLHPLPGAADILAELRDGGIPLALASSGSMEKIVFNLERAGLIGFFDRAHIVSGEDFVRGKPDPEIFIRAAERLQCEPARCAVIEDSINGLRAARAAGCLAIAVTNTFPSDRLAPHADIVIGSLRELAVGRLTAVLGERDSVPRA